MSLQFFSNGLKLIIIRKLGIASILRHLFHKVVEQWSELKMKSQRPDLMVIISFIFVIGAVATSLSANSDDRIEHPQVTQHIIR